MSGIECDVQCSILSEDCYGVFIAKSINIQSLS